MPEWDAQTRSDFASAEYSLVRAQVTAWRNTGPWEAWAHIAERALTHYGELLVAEKFTEIREMAARLA